MGLLRFLLAAAVVLGHAGYVGFLLPYYAVQAFFVISGFYMALIQTKYEGRIGSFYLNRYSRIAVPYWIVALATIIFLRQMTNFPLAEKHSIPPLLAFSNLAVFGQDAVNFFTVRGEVATNWLLIPQAWSLSTELLFYAFVPFLAKMRTRTLIALGALSIAIRFATLDLSFYPWQQKFFPSEFLFFLVGMLAYRHAPKINGILALVLTCAVVTLSGHLWTEPNLSGSMSLAGVLFFLSGSMALAAVLFFAVPSVFALTKRSAIDRFIGEFSYPVYLWQVFVLSIFGYQVTALLWCVLFSLPMVLFVEKPMERWRERRLNSGDRDSKAEVAVQSRPMI